MTFIKRLMLYVAKYTGVFLWAERVTRRHLRVFSYAGFADDAAPEGFISLRTFEKRARKIHDSRYPVLSLDEASGCLARADLPDHATVILIDDSARGGSEGAMAVLQHYHFPVTFRALGAADNQLPITAPGEGKKTLASNPGFKSGATNCYKLIWLRDREDIQAIEFEAELSGFLDICRGLAKNLLRRG